MKIAIMISTYNGEKYLNEQLKSIYNQSINAYICVYIRDDGSTDTTLSIIKNWKEKLNISIILGENIGPANSFWSMIKASNISADYYAFCDQDDIWDEDKLEKAVSKLYGECHMYISNCRLIDGNGTVIQEKMRGAEPTISIQRMFVSGIAQGCSMVFTDEFRQFIINKRVTCIPMHDLILLLYATCFGSIVWDEQPRFSYRLHSNNVVAKNNKNIFRRIRTTCKNWKNSKKNSMQEVAKEMLENKLSLSKGDKAFLIKMSSYKSSFLTRLWIIRSIQFSDFSYKAFRSFSIRIFLKIL